MVQKLMLLVFISVVLAYIPSITIAKDFVVGDETGWTTGFNYQAWANGKKFTVGDKLVFKYAKGVHNVFKVNGTGFENCIVPSQNEALVSGVEMIKLPLRLREESGTYICGLKNHCKTGGQKLVITVKGSRKKGKSSANSMATSGFLTLILNVNGMTAQRLELGGWYH